MYKLESKGKSLFQNNSRQIVRITYTGVTTADGELVGNAIVGTAIVDAERLGIDLSEVTILQGGLTIDRYCASGSMIELGTAIAAELTMTLRNTNGDLDNINFEGAELYVEIGVRDWSADGGAVYWVPMGYFIVDTPPRHLSTISITALDRMVLFDRDVLPDKLSFSTTVEQLILKCCAICGVVPDTSNLSQLPNAGYVIKAFPAETDNLTYRQLIQWCAALTGTCAYMDRYGHLTFRWFTMPTDSDDVFTVSPSNRYSSDIYENDIVITGFTFNETDEDGNETGHIVGDDSYAFDLTGNALLQDDVDTALTVLQDALGGFTYRPHEASLLPAPWIEPLDMVKFEDKNGNIHDTIVTHTTFTMNSSTAISGVGETSQYNSYAGGSGLTLAQANILEKVKASVNYKIKNRDTAILALNETIANSMGLHRIEVTENGTSTYYFCDAATLEDSSVIYTFNAGGFAWTNDWNSGNPVWQSGFTRDGNAVLNMLNTYKITSDYIESGSISVESLNSSFVATVDRISSSVSSTAASHPNMLYQTRRFDTDGGSSTLLTDTYMGLQIRRMKNSTANSTGKLSYVGYTSGTNMTPITLTASNPTCTFSFYAKSDTEGMALTVFPGGAGHENVSVVTSQGNTLNSAGYVDFDLTTDWDRYSITWTYSGYDKAQVNLAWMYVYYGFTVYTCGGKLEYGDTATEWTPAPEDGETAVAVLQSKVNQYADRIELMVTSDNIRSAFAMDSSSVAIDTGAIAFNSNTITIDSDNFKLQANGTVKAYGSFNASANITDRNRVTTSLTNGTITMTSEALSSSGEVTNSYTPLAITLGTDASNTAGYTKIDLYFGTTDHKVIGLYGGTTPKIELLDYTEMKDSVVITNTNYGGKISLYAPAYDIRDQYESRTGETVSIRTNATYAGDLTLNGITGEGVVYQKSRLYANDNDTILIMGYSGSYYYSTRALWYDYITRQLRLGSYRTTEGGSWSHMMTFDFETRNVMIKGQRINAYLPNATLATTAEVYKSSMQAADTTMLTTIANNNADILNDVRNKLNSLIGLLNARTWWTT